MTIDEIKKNLEDAFIQTDLYDQFEYGVDSEKDVNIYFDQNERLRVMSLPTSYKISNIADISQKNYDVKRKNRKDNCNYVSILFDDGVVLKCVLHGLELQYEDRVYHGSMAVSYRLNYIYRTDVTGLSVNPLIIKDREVVAYCGNSERIVVPEGVVTIGEYAFEHSSVARLSFPRTLRDISDYCFSGCKNIENIVFDGNDEYIGDDVFMREKTKKQIEVPARIKFDRVKVFDDLGLQIQYQD